MRARRCLLADLIGMELFQCIGPRSAHCDGTSGDGLPWANIQRKRMSGTANGMAQSRHPLADVILSDGTVFCQFKLRPVHA
jgi:hypothetical protein